jgi:hypothetical protein
MHPPVTGQPVVKDLRVHQDGSKFLVEFSYLPFGDEKERQKNGYERSLLITDVPFEPVADLKKTVNVGIHPAMVRRGSKTPGVVKVNMWPRPVPAAIRSMVAQPPSAVVLARRSQPRRLCHMLRVAAN